MELSQVWYYFVTHADLKAKNKLNICSTSLDSSGKIITDMYCGLRFMSWLLVDKKSNMWK